MTTTTRRRAPVAERVDDPVVDRILRNHDERIRELANVLSPSGITQLITQNTAIFNTLVTGSSIVYGASSLTTSASRRWLVFPGAAAGTSVAGSGYYSVPNGITRATGLALAVFAGGSAGQTITYVLTEGTPTTETDTALKITTASDFFGTVNISGSVPLTPARCLRVAADKSGALGSAVTGVAIYVQLSG